MWSVGKVQFHGVTKSIFRSKYATYLSIRIYHVHNESMGCEGKRVKKIRLYTCMAWRSIKVK